MNNKAPLLTQWHGLSDDALVQTLKSGSTDAFAEVVLRYQKFVSAVVVARILDWDLAEDVVQQVFLEAYQKIQSIDDGKKLKAWLRVIADRRAIDFLRRQKPTVDMHEDEHVSKDLSPEAYTSQREESLILRSALDEMNEAEREILLNYYWHGESVRELARRFTISTGSARQRLSRARSKLKQDVELMLRSSILDHKPGRVGAMAILLLLGLRPSLSAASPLTAFTRRPWLKLSGFAVSGLTLLAVLGAFTMRHSSESSELAREALKPADNSLFEKQSASFTLESDAVAKSTEGEDYALRIAVKVPAWDGPCSYAIVSLHGAKEIIEGDDTSPGAKGIRLQLYTGMTDSSGILKIKTLPEDVGSAQIMCFSKDRGDSLDHGQSTVVSIKAGQRELEVPIHFDEVPDASPRTSILYAPCHFFYMDLQKGALTSHKFTNWLDDPSEGPNNSRDDLDGDGLISSAEYAVFNDRINHELKRLGSEKEKGSYNALSFLEGPVHCVQENPQEKKILPNPFDGDALIRVLSPFCPFSGESFLVTEGIQNNNPTWPIETAFLSQVPARDDAIVRAHCAANALGRGNEFLGAWYAERDDPQSSGEPAWLTYLAKKIGLSQGAFVETMNSDECESQLNENQEASSTAGISSTPLLLYGGERLLGARSLKYTKDWIEARLGE